MVLNEMELLGKQFAEELQRAQNTADLEAMKVKYLGKKGPIQNLMKGLREASDQERPLLGKQINDLKESFAQEIEKRYEALSAQEQEVQFGQERIDITAPGRKRFPGRKHPITKVMDDMIDILAGMGFSVQYGPDIETEYYNFEALNFPPNHPARDMQDTFYINPEVLLRTHTSNVQVRVMEAHKPPIRVIAPGKVYRNETITARSHVFFHQIEGFYVDEGVSFADLLSTMDEFLSKVFHREVKTRYRPSYFPFVEPGMEIDVACLACDGKGCNLCKHSGWLEVAGAGMIHPEILKNCGIDPEVYTGYAWGLGVDRIAMLLHGVPDIRMFTINDQRFLAQFPAL